MTYFDTSKYKLLIIRTWLSSYRSIQIWHFSYILDLNEYFETWKNEKKKCTHEIWNLKDISNKHIER
jgi:hypothetical protein